MTEPTSILPAAAGEANAALDLVDREQARLVGQLPDLLTGLHQEAAADVTAKELHDAGCAVLGEVSGFLRLVTHEDGGGVAAFRIAACEGRNELLSGLFDAVYECVIELGRARDDAMARGLIGGLHALLATAAEELSSSGALRVLILKDLDGLNWHHLTSKLGNLPTSPASRPPLPSI